MKQLYLLLFTIGTFQIVSAQSATKASAVNKPNTSHVKFAPFDKSPLDVIYYPANYPVLKIQDRAAEPLFARLIYSRPQKNNRPIFGDLVDYGQLWRLGANEATELELFRDVKIDDKKLSRGRYTLYAIPQEQQWTIIFNKETDTWGAFKYDDKKDALRITVPVQKTSFTTDAFSATFAKSDTGADLIFAWDDVMAVIPFNLK